MEIEDKTYFLPGTYKANVTGQSLTKTKKGRPQFQLNFSLLGKVRDDKTVEECEAYERTCYMTITEKSVEYVLADLASIGFDGNSFAKLSESSADYHNFVGIQISVSCEHNVYEGVKREQWRIFWGGSTAEQLGAAEIRELDALYADELKKIKKQPANAQVGAAEEQMPVAQSALDVPF